MKPRRAAGRSAPAVLSFLDTGVVDYAGFTASPQHTIYETRHAPPAVRIGRTDGRPQYDLHNTDLAYLRMVRTRRWKYVRHFHANFMDELYDLEKDPGETRNLMTRKGPRRGTISPEEFARLNEMLDSWIKSIEDPLLDDQY